MITGNTATDLGGGIDVLGKGTVSGTLFTNNSAKDGGAIYSAKSTTLTVGGASSFTGNTAQDGGAIETRARCSVSRSTFSSNTATGGTDFWWCDLQQPGQGHRQ